MTAEHDWQRTLAFYEHSEWTVILNTGDAVVVFADSHGLEDDYRVFNMAIAGQPVSLLPVAKFPESIIRDTEFKPEQTSPGFVPQRSAGTGGGQT
jgi:hypothetical protein